MKKEYTLIDINNAFHEGWNRALEEMKKELCESIKGGLKWEI